MPWDFVILFCFGETLKFSPYFLLSFVTESAEHAPSILFTFQILHTFVGA